MRNPFKTKPATTQPARVAHPTGKCSCCGHSMRRGGTCPQCSDLGITTGPDGEAVQLVCGCQV